MNITKFGHCCLLIETKDLRILTDPGTYSEGQNTAHNIDVVLITHEHGDHLHIDSLKQILANNPSARVITNSAVGKLLDAEGIAYEVLEEGDTSMVGEVLLEAFGHEHAEVYAGLITPVMNTGYFVDERLFYPGDAFTDPQKPVEILALPMAGPWMKLSEAIDYAKALKPQICFPVHDGILKTPGMMNRVGPLALEPEGIRFVAIEENGVVEF
jgi:L-ascorbate metabolism protein UlaG (beta-lactamase superfamily)